MLTWHSAVKAAACGLVAHGRSGRGSGRGARACRSESAVLCNNLHVGALQFGKRCYVWVLHVRCVQKADYTWAYNNCVCDFRAVVRLAVFAGKGKSGACQVVCLKADRVWI